MFLENQDYIITRFPWTVVTIDVCIDLRHDIYNE